MYASIQDRQVSNTWLFRNCGRLGGLIVMVSWISLAIYEAVRSGAPAPKLIIKLVRWPLCLPGMQSGGRRKCWAECWPWLARFYSMCCTWLRFTRRRSSRLRCWRCPESFTCSRDIRMNIAAAR